jgi:four helix bundle protein
MGNAKRFEDLQIWKDSRQFCQFVAHISPLLVENHLYRLKDQIEGSSGSIMDNIAEGYERTGKKELINFLIIAKGSAGELRSQLYRLLDNDVISQEDFNVKYNQLISLSRQITGFIKYLKNTDIDGWRWSEPPSEYLIDSDGD